VDSGSSEGRACTNGPGDYGCSCAVSSSPNSTQCSASTLTYPGACCAGPGWPSSGACFCVVFVCHNSAGSVCRFDPNVEPGDTTTATGNACCLISHSDGGPPDECYCQSDPSLCAGYPSVSSCTIDTLPACSNFPAYTPVSSCSG
jgi:hypothetical protein